MYKVKTLAGLTLALRDSPDEARRVALSVASSQPQGLRIVGPQGDVGVVTFSPGPVGEPGAVREWSRP